MTPKGAVAGTHNPLTNPLGDLTCIPLYGSRNDSIAFARTDDCEPENEQQHPTGSNDTQRDNRRLDPGSRTCIVEASVCRSHEDHEP